MKHLLKFVLLVALTTAGYLYYDKVTQGFRVHKIRSERPYCLEWDVPTSPEVRERLPAILAQTFTYLGKGAQSYAFLSSDKKTVLKFFKQQHYRVDPWVEAMRFPPALNEYRLHKRQKKSERIDKLCNSFIIANQELQKQTAIFFLHFNNTQDEVGNVNFVDALGRNFELNLDNYQFALQSYAEEPFYKRIVRLNNDGDNAAIKDAFRQVLGIIVSRYQQGIYEIDPAIGQNYSFAEKTLIHVDVGTYRRDPTVKNPQYIKDNLRYFTREIPRKLQKRAPELIAIYEDELQNALQAL